MPTYRVSNSLFLVAQPVSKKPAAPEKIVLPVHHVVVIDCSGSMYSDLPKVREQLKKRIPKLLKEKDTLSIIWFSGRGEYGTLLEAEPVATLADLQAVNQAIDRWLKPVCLTGFKEPLEEAGRLIERLAKKSKDPVSLFFMSDGCDNQWSRREILAAVTDLSTNVASATFVEYGYYADRALLTAMAEKAGGTVIFSEDFDRYAPQFEAALARKVSGAPKVEVEIHGDPYGGFAFAISDSELLTFGIEESSVVVPEDTGEIYYLAPDVPPGDTAIELGPIAKTASERKTTQHESGLRAAYAALSLYAQRMNSNVVFALLKATGDVSLIDQFASCFGKQRYSEFVEITKTAAIDPSHRFVQGHNPNRVPREDAFTVLELLRILSDDDSNRVLLDHPEFKYSRIGRGRVDASEQLSADEQRQIQELTAKMASEKNPKKVKAIADQIAVISSKGSSLKFVPDQVDDGYPVSSLTFNEDRPNVSFLVKRPGTVDLSSQLGEFKGVIPESFRTFVYRNYTVVKDGLVNIERLPAIISGTTMERLRSADLPADSLTVTASSEDSFTVVFNLKSLPVINRQMVKDTSASTLFQKQYSLTKLQAAQKVYNSYKKTHFPRKSASFELVFGADAANWLKERGITDYSGFSPKTVQADAMDFYMGKELKVSLKNLSTLPSVPDVKKRMASGKHTATSSLMAPIIQEVEDFLASPAYTNAADKEAVFEAWINGQAKATTQQVRALIYEQACIKFSVVVGQTWFSEFTSLDENTLTIDVDGQRIEGKVEMKEVKISI